MNPHNTCIKTFNTQWLTMTMTIKCARTGAASVKNSNTC